jgi:protein O-mannosyl-transferase
MPNASSSAPTRAAGWRLLIAALLVAVTLAIYWPLKQCDFTNFDDPDYVTRNPHVLHGLTGRGIAWAFTQIHAGNWHPLTWISHMADCQLFGLNPAGHHFVSLGLHLANALLLFWLFEKMTGAAWRSAMVAALFAWHPLHVESVAWISERKDVLSTCFGLLAMLAYVHYTQRATGRSGADPEGGNPRAGPLARPRLFYLLSLCLFALSLLSKPMLVTLPFVLLLIDFWPLQRWDCSRAGWRVLRTRLLVEKLPFFALSFLSSAVTFYVQRKTGAVISLEQKPFPDRLVNVLHSYVGYLEKMAYPKDLCAYYFSQWQDTRFALALVLVVALTLLALLAARRWRFVTTGWLWYLGTLVPVIGLIQVGSQAMADRYTYFPSIGIFTAVVWVGAEAFRRFSRWSVGLICGAVLSVLALAAWFQVPYWQSSITLFTHALRVGQVSPIAHHNLGHGLMETTDGLDEAMRHFKRALEFYPGYPQAHYCLGNCLSVAGQLAEAEAHYREAISNKASFGEAYYGLANVMALKGRPDEARKCFEEALRLKPYYAEAHTKLGNLLLLQGDRPAGMKHLRTAVELLPTYADGHYYLATACAEQQQFEEAIVHLYAAVRLKPRYAAAFNDLAWVLAAEPKAPHNAAEAVRLARKACEYTGFKEPRYLDTLAVAYATQGQTNEARTTCQQALALASAASNAFLVRHLETQLSEWQETPATNRPH